MKTAYTLYLDSGQILGLHGILEHQVNEAIHKMQDRRAKGETVPDCDVHCVNDIWDIVQQLQRIITPVKGA